MEIRSQESDPLGIDSGGLPHWIVPGGTGGKDTCRLLAPRLVGEGGDSPLKRKGRPAEGSLCSTRPMVPAPSSDSKSIGGAALLGGSGPFATGSALRVVVAICLLNQAAAR